MASIATVTSKGQVTLPVAVRRALSISTGDRLEFTVETDHVVVRFAPDFLALAGTVDVPADVRGAPWRQIRKTAYQNGKQA